MHINDYSRQTKGHLLKTSEAVGGFGWLLIIEYVFLHFLHFRKSYFQNVCHGWPFSLLFGKVTLDWKVKMESISLRTDTFDDKYLAIYSFRASQGYQLMVSCHLRQILWEILVTEHHLRPLDGCGLQWLAERTPHISISCCEFALLSGLASEFPGQRRSPKQLGRQVIPKQTSVYFKRTNYYLNIFFYNE